MKVKLPTGQTIEVPPGLSKEEFKAYVQARMTPAPVMQHVPDIEAGAGKSFLLSAGAEAERAMHNIKRAAYTGADILGFEGREPKIEEEKRAVRDIDRMMAPLKEEHPIATTLGSMAPYAAMPYQAGIAPAAISGAGMGLMSTPPDSDMIDSMLTGGAMGTLGYGATKLGGMFLRPLKSKFDEAGQALVNWAKEKGIKFQPGQELNRQVMKSAEDRLNLSPMTAGPGLKAFEQNQPIINKIASEAVGSPTDSLNAAWWKKAQEKIDAGYKAFEKYQIEFPNTHRAKLFSILKEYDTKWGVAKNDLKPFIKDALKESGTITGKRFNDIVKGLRASADSAAKSNPNLAYSLRQLRDTMEEVAEIALERNGKLDALNTFRQTREWQRNMFRLRETGVVKGHNVDAKQLASALKKRDYFGYTQGNNTSDFYNIARVADVAGQISNPTGRPSMARFDPLTMYALGSGTGAGMMTQSPAIGLGVAAAPWAASKLYNTGWGTTKGKIPFTSLLSDEMVNRLGTFGGRVGGLLGTQDRR